MCILSYLPAGVPVEPADLLNGGISNPDGHGWAITAGDRIITGKAMDICDALDSFITAREANPEGHALFHSRWATHGSVNLDNVHPFFVKGSNDLTVMAHNGILPCTPRKCDPRSDTRVFADEYLPTRFRRLDRAKAFAAMQGYIGRGNKLVILTVDPRYQRNAYIVNESVGHWDTATGVWHSNYDYLGYGRYARVSTTIGKADTAAIAARSTSDTEPRYIGRQTPFYDRGECDTCGFGRIGVGGFCDGCGTCEDCGEWRDDCQCWVNYGYSGSYGMAR